jgi:RNA polymerase sigma factor (sigma-70 family)
VQTAAAAPSTPVATSRHPRIAVRATGFGESNTLVIRDGARDSTAGDAAYAPDGRQTGARRADAGADRGPLGREHSIDRALQDPVANPVGSDGLGNSLEGRDEIAAARSGGEAQAVGHGDRVEGVGQLPGRRTMTTQHDISLVQRAVAGDRAGQRALAARLLDAIHGEVALVLGRHAALRGGHTRQDALDLVQAVLVELFGSNAAQLRRWDPARGRDLESFVRIVARRRVARVLGHARSTAWGSSPLAATGEDAEPESQVRIDRRDQLELVLDQLYADMDDQDAELFELAFVDDLDAAEIGRRVGMPANAVEAWRLRASSGTTRRTGPSTTPATPRKIARRR